MNSVSKSVAISLLQMGENAFKTRNLFVATDKYIHLAMGKAVHFCYKTSDHTLLHRGLQTEFSEQLQCILSECILSNGQKRVSIQQRQQLNIFEFISWPG